MNTRWEEIRAISVSTSLIHCARGGASTPIRRSAATTNGTSLANPDTQSIRLMMVMIWG